MKRAELSSTLACDEPRKRKSAFDRALQKSRNTPERAGRFKANGTASTDAEVGTSEPRRTLTLRNVIDLDSDDDDEEFNRWKERRFDRSPQPDPSNRQQHSQAEQIEDALSSYTEIHFDQTTSATQPPVAVKDSRQQHSCDGESTERSQRSTARLPVGSHPEDIPIERPPNEGSPKVSEEEMAQMCVKTKLEAIQTAQEKDKIIAQLEAKCRSLVAASEKTTFHPSDARLRVAGLVNVTVHNMSAERSASFPFVNSDNRGDEAAIPLLMEAKKFWDSVQSSNLKAGLVGKINMKFLQLCRDRDILKKDNKSLRTSLQKMLLKNLVDRIDENMRDILNDYSQTDVVDDERISSPGCQQYSQEPAHPMAVSVVSERSQKTHPGGQLQSQTPVESFTEVLEAGELPESLEAAVQWSEAAIARIREDRERALKWLDQRSTQREKTTLRQPPITPPAIQDAEPKQLVKTTPAQQQEVSASFSRSPTFGSAFGITLTVSRGRDFPLSGYRSVPTRIVCCVSVLENCDLEAHHKLLVTHSLLGSHSVQVSTGGTCEQILPQQQGREVSFNPDPEWNETFTISSSLARADKKQGAEANQNGWVKTPLLGAEMLLLVTMHGLCASDSASLIARLLLPIRPGRKTADWFMVLSADGYPLVGESGKQSYLHLEADFGPALHSRLPPKLSCIPMHSKETALALTRFSEEDSCGISLSITAHLCRFQSNPEVFVEHFLRDIADAMNIARDRLQYSGMTRGSATMMFNLLPDVKHAQSSQTPLSLSLALIVMMMDPGSRLRQLPSTKDSERLIVHGPVPKVPEDDRVMTPRTAAEQHKRLIDLEWRLTALESDELQKNWKQKRAGLDGLDPVTADVLFEPTDVLLSSGGNLAPSARKKKFQETPSFRRRLSVEAQASVTQNNWRRHSVASSRSLSPSPRASAREKKFQETPSFRRRLSVESQASVTQNNWRRHSVVSSRSLSPSPRASAREKTFQETPSFRRRLSVESQASVTQNNWRRHSVVSSRSLSPSPRASAREKKFQETPSFRRRLSVESQASVTQNNWRRHSVVSSRSLSLSETSDLSDEIQSVSMLSCTFEDASWRDGVLTPISADCLFQPQKDQVVLTQQWSPRRTQQWTPPTPREPKRLAGVGLSLKQDINERSQNEVYIGMVIRGSSADLCGRILQGDVLLAVDGRDLQGRGADIVQNYLIGEEGSSVSLQLKRANDWAGRTMYTVSLVRGSLQGSILTYSGTPWESISTSPPKFSASLSRSGTQFSSDSVASPASAGSRTLSKPPPKPLNLDTSLNLHTLNLEITDPLRGPGSPEPQVLGTSINETDSPRSSTSPSVLQLKQIERRRSLEDLAGPVSPPISPIMPRVLLTSPRRMSVISADNVPRECVPVLVNIPLSQVVAKPTAETPAYQSSMRLTSDSYESPARLTAQSYKSPRYIDTSPRYDISPRKSPVLRSTENPSSTRTIPVSLPSLPLAAVTDRKATPGSTWAPALKLPPMHSSPRYDISPRYDAFGLVHQSPRLDEPAFFHHSSPSTPHPSPERRPSGSPPTRVPQDPVTMRIAATLETPPSPAALPGRERQEERKAVHRAGNIGGEWRVDSLIVEACGLVRLHGVGQPNLFCKVSVGAAAGDTAWQELAAQHGEGGEAKQTEVIMGTMEPVWRNMFSFGNEQTEKERPRAGSWSKIAGQALQLMVTVHDMMGSTSAFRGMVLVPVLAGLSEDCWYTLQNRDGSHMYGPDGSPSRIRIQTHYWQPPPSLPPLSLPISPLAFMPPVASTEMGSMLSAPRARSSMTITLPTDTVHTEDVVVTASLTPRNFYDSPSNQSERIITPKLDRQRSALGSASRNGQPGASMPPVARSGWHQKRDDTDSRQNMRWSSASGSSDTLGYGGDLSSFSMECL